MLESSGHTIVKNDNIFMEEHGVCFDFEFLGLHFTELWLDYTIEILCVMLDGSCVISYIFLKRNRNPNFEHHGKFILKFEEGHGIQNRRKLPKF